MLRRTLGSSLLRMPSLMLPNHYEPKDSDREHYIIGAIYDQTKQLVGLWTAEKDDGHVEFWCVGGHQFDSVTEDWCDDIAPAVVDIVDDGSGSEREPRIVDAAVLRANA